MFIFSVLAFSSLFVATVSTVLAIKGKHQMYWIAALGIYIFSFLAGFSIGQLTVGVTFILLALAVGFTFNLIKRKLHTTLFISAGVLVGFVMVVYVDDSLVFYPFKLFM